MASLRALKRQNRKLRKHLASCLALIERDEGSDTRAIHVADFGVFVAFVDLDAIRAILAKNEGAQL